MYSIEEFDESKSKVLKYILYKKRTENEIRIKFRSTINEEMLEDIIQHLKEANYINDLEYLEKIVNEFIRLKDLSLKELEYKLLAKGIARDEIENYFNLHEEELEQYERNSIQKLIQKKKNLLELQEIRNYLLRKGYSSQKVKEELQELEEG